MVLRTFSFVVAELPNLIRDRKVALPSLFLSLSISPLLLSLSLSRSLSLSLSRSLARSLSLDLCIPLAIYLSLYLSISPLKRSHLKTAISPGYSGGHDLPLSGRAIASIV